MLLNPRVKEPTLHGGAAARPVESGDAVVYMCRPDYHEYNMYNEESSGARLDEEWPGNTPESRVE